MDGYETALNKICHNYEKDGWTIANKVMDEALKKMYDAWFSQFKNIMIQDGLFEVENDGDTYKITGKIPSQPYSRYQIAEVKT